MSDGLMKTNRKIQTTRLESWVMPGIPDVLFCSESGVFSFVELKVVRGTKVDLSPHQVAFLSRHAHAPVWIATRSRDLVIRVFAGADAVDLRMDGLAAVPALAVFEEPYAWGAFFALICPIESV